MLLGGQGGRFIDFILDFIDHVIIHIYDVVARS